MDWLKTSLTVKYGPQQVTNFRILSCQTFQNMFVYLPRPYFKHSFQGLVKDLDGNENKNKNIHINHK